MTMPIERARAMRWGAALLDLLADDPEVVGDLRAMASDLRLIYPMPDLLKAHLLSGTQGIPAVWVAAFQEAGRLCATLQYGRQGSGPGVSFAAGSGASTVRGVAANPSTQAWAPKAWERGDDDAHRERPCDAVGRCLVRFAGGRS